MKSNLSLHSLKLSVVLFVGTTLTNCQREEHDVLKFDLNTQRVKAQTVFYLGTYLDQISIDTALITGTVYPVSAKDSMSFHYDDQQRLVDYTLTQVLQSYGQPHTTATRSEYIYQGGSMTEREGIGPQGNGLLYHHPLIGSGRQVATYTKKRYAYIQFDSLRTYSSEGLLLSALQVDLKPPYSPATLVLPNTKTTIQVGNITRQDSYNSFSGVLGNTTRYIYDTKRLAPLATFTFLGEASRNALVQKVYTSYQPDGKMVDYTHVYTYYNEYDKQGRMTRQTEYVQGGVYPQKRALSLTKYYY